MLVRLLPALLLVPSLAAAADAPKPVVIRPVQAKPAATPVATKPVAPAKPAPPPFPAPVVGPVTQDLRYTSGVVTLVDPEKKVFEVNTPTGRLISKIIETSRVIGLDGQPMLFADLKVGAALRLYYRTGKGAEVAEADLLPAAQ